MDEKKWLHEKWARQVIKNLNRNFMNGYYFPTVREAVPKILEQIPEGAVVGLGDSLTLEQIGLITLLEQGNYQLQNPWAQESTKQKIAMQRQIFTSDVFLVGTNALTLNGELINVDGLGNRVAATIFGPKKVIVIVGVNKIVKNIEDGINRIKSIAAPANAKRHEYPEDRRPPCANTGLCVDCKPPHTICCSLVIIRGQMFSKDRINVFIIDEELGL